MTEAEIIHVEDEPRHVLDQILHLGLRPGSTVTIWSRTPEFLLVSDGEREHRLPPVVAGNIHVRGTATRRLPAETRSLSDLRDGEEAEVVEIDPQFRGFARRRLLDLGMTPGTPVTAELSNAFGDPRAYRVRGTLIALRNDQAARVRVRHRRPVSAPVGGVV
jgi:DtxR family Mn-dependent transcriptional regulator